MRQSIARRVPHVFGPLPIFRLKRAKYYPSHNASRHKPARRFHAGSLRTSFSHFPQESSPSARSIGRFLTRSSYSPGGPIMTGYQARWDNSPVKAGVLKMSARTIRSIAAAGAIGSIGSIPRRPPASRGDPSKRIAAGRALHASAGSRTDAGRAASSNASPIANPQPLTDSPLKLTDETPKPCEANSPAHPANEPVAAPIEPVPAKPEDWSDLIALAGDGHCTHTGDLLQRASEPSASENKRRDSSSLFWPARASETSALESSGSESDPLATLTLEYRQALLSQKSGNMHMLKTASADSNGPAGPTQHDPFAELAPRSQAESSVFDLLTHGRNVDTLLDSLDAFGSGQIFQADEPHEILALLAPRGLAPRRPSQAAQLAREEHHLVSVDSHMSVPDSIEYEEAECQDEHDR
ncbi:MAG TPA: TagK domain-containing protein [Paraburkholderia sp.]